jgi:hypothetical protein
VYCVLCTVYCVLCTVYCVLCLCTVSAATTGVAYLKVPTPTEPNCATSTSTGLPAAGNASTTTTSVAPNRMVSEPVVTRPKPVRDDTLSVPDSTTLPCVVSDWQRTAKLLRQ